MVHLLTCLCSSLSFVKGVVLYSRDNRELDLLLFWEVCDFVSRVDRVLSRPGGSLLLAGRSGVGRHTATSLVSHMHGYTLFTPKISRGYTLKHFSNDLKTVREDSYFYWYTLCLETSIYRMHLEIIVVYWKTFKTYVV